MILALGASPTSSVLPYGAYRAGPRTLELNISARISSFGASLTGLFIKEVNPSTEFSSGAHVGLSVRTYKGRSLEAATFQRLNL